MISRLPPPVVPSSCGAEEPAFAGVPHACPERSRRVSPLLGDVGIERHHPHMRRLGIRRQIHIHCCKQHPLPIRRHHRLFHPLQLHHVFKSERSLLRGGRKHNCHNTCRYQKTTHPWPS